MKYIIAFLFFITLVSCKENNDNKTVSEQKDKLTVETSEIKSVPIIEPNKSYDLNYNLDKNKTYQYRISTTSSDHQKVTTSDTTFDMTINQSAEYLAGLNLKDIDKNGILEVNCNVSSVKINMRQEPSQNSISYESGVTPDSIVKQRFAEYDALVHNEFGIRISKFGEISDIYKVDNILKKYLDLKGASDSVTTTEKDQVRMEIIEGILKPLVLQIFRQLPEKSVGVDSSWSFSQPPTPLIVFKSENTTTYKLTSLEKSGDDKLAVIQAGLITKVTGDNTLTKNGVVYNFNKPKTQAGGQIYFNLSQGVIQKSKTSTKISLSFSMEMQTPKGKQKGNKEEETTTINTVELL
ncbi:MAG: DUF6263 family protein [Ignavibacteriaceae bacterium]